MLKAYYYLTKPGIIYGNLLTATAGFVFASRGYIHYHLLAYVLIGIALIIGSACTFNNYLDKDIDRVMSRTKKRALVIGKISDKKALVFASVIGLVGLLVLIFHTNSLVVILGLIAFIDYVVLYGYAKRHTIHSTLVGSISGAAPIVAGYCAVTDKFDGGALILFLILVFWQMPHFYAIAMYRFKDYKAAKLPVLPVVKGLRTTKIQIILYIVAFTAACCELKVYGYADSLFLIVMLVAGLVWLWFGLKGFSKEPDEPWARRMFFISLIVNLLLSLMLVVSSFQSRFSLLDF